MFDTLFCFIYLFLFLFQCQYDFEYFKANVLLFEKSRRIA